MNKKNTAFALAFVAAVTLGGTARGDCVNMLLSASSASGNSAEKVVTSTGYQQLDLKLTGFQGHIYIFAGNVSGRLHQIYDGDYSSGTTTCPTAAGTADPCLITNIQGYNIFKLYYTRTAGTIDSADICTVK